MPEKESHDYDGGDLLAELRDRPSKELVALIHYASILLAWIDAWTRK